MTADERRPLLSLRPPGRLVLVLAVCGVLVSLGLGVLLGRWTAAPERSGGPPGAAEEETEWWTCSMHPQIKLPDPGACPICGMDLIPLEEGGGEERAPRELRLSETAAALAEVQTRPVERRAVAREVRMVGKVAYDETRLKYITAWFPGRLDRLYVDFTGTIVRRGDHLADVFSPELLSAQEELLQALQARRRLEDDGTRLLRGTARATVDAVREKLRLWGLTDEQIEAVERSGQARDHMTIYAPMGGVVVHKSKHAGDYVETGERIYTIADLSSVWIKLDAYESDLAWVRYGQTVTFEVEAYPGETFAGRVVFVDPVLTPETRTVKVRLNVENPDRRLKPGMFVRAVLEAPLAAGGRTMEPSLAGKWICPMHWEEIEEEAGECSICGMPLVPAESIHGSADEPAEPPLVVPASAVLWTGVRSVVYVRLPGDAPRYEGRVIELGPRAGERYVVRAGLEEGERVVTRGAFKIDSALQIEARPSMMLPPEDEPERLEVSAAALRELDPVLAAYLELQAALAADDLARARAGFARLLAAAARAGGPAEPDARAAWLDLRHRLLGAAAPGPGSPGLAAARRAFRAVAEVAIELERRFGHAEGRLRLVHCPMAFDGDGADWLQRGEEVANPYSGASMLRCGEVRETLAPAQPAAGLEGGDAADDAAPTTRPSGDGGDGDTGAAPEPGGDGEVGDTGAAPEPGGDGGDGDTGAAPEPGGDGAAGRAAGFRGGLDALVAAYLGLQRDLAADEASGAEHAPNLRAALADARGTGLPAGEREAWRELRARLEEAVRGLGGAEGAAAQRRAFGSLSAALIEALRRLDRPLQRALRVFHCPMAFDGAGADWLQEEERTANPYFGSRMLRCGSQVEVLRPGGAR